MKLNLELLIKKSMKVFIKPVEIYPYEKIIKGVEVVRSSGEVTTLSAVDESVWSSFEKIDNPNTIFQSYFIENRKEILEKLKNITGPDQIDSLENKIIKDIKKEMEKNTLKGYSKDTLEPYNKLRFPVDQAIEHIVCMCDELEGYRGSVVRHMFLPLGDKILSNDLFFSSKELTEYKLSKEPTFGEVKDKYYYRKIQNKMRSLAEAMSHRSDNMFFCIFFDLLWNHRYRNEGNNLFQVY